MKDRFLLSFDICQRSVRYKNMLQDKDNFFVEMKNDYIVSKSFISQIECNII